MSKDYEVAYVCDRLACGEQCPSLLAPDDYCTHTTDINHAVNFAKVADDKYAEINDKILNFLSETKESYKDDDHGEYYSS